MTILLVDDEPSMRVLVARMLEAAGHEVVEAPDGREAWRLVQKLHPAVHLVITDVVMPHLTGTELAARIEKFWPGLPVLLMSAFSADELKARRLSEPRFPIITKPFSAESLLEAVQAAMRPGSRERRRTPRTPSTS